MNDGERRELEEAHRAATHKAAALHNLGWEVGAGATIWARAVEDALARHAEMRARHTAGGTNITFLERREVWERLHSSALMVVVAINQVLSYERRVRRLTGDGDLNQARQRVDAVCRDADDLRDLILHLEDYAVGEGWRQTGHGKQPPLNETYLATFIYWVDDGGTQLALGDRWINLHDAAEAAIELADVVERVRARHLHRAEQEANAALRQLRGPGGGG